jgi:hypothetical protein
MHYEVKEIVLLTTISAFAHVLALSHLNIVNAPFHYFIAIILDVVQSVAFLRHASEGAVETSLAADTWSLFDHRGKPKVCGGHVPMVPYKHRACKKQNEANKKVPWPHGPLLDLLSTKQTVRMLCR